jgi:hypothetical protein
MAVPDAYVCQRAVARTHRGSLAGVGVEGGCDGCRSIVNCLLGCQGCAAPHRPLENSRNHRHEFITTSAWPL